MASEYLRTLKSIFSPKCNLQVIKQWTSKSKNFIFFGAWFLAFHGFLFYFDYLYLKHEYQPKKSNDPSKKDLLFITWKPFHNKCKQTFYLYLESHRVLACLFWQQNCQLNIADCYQQCRQHWSMKTSRSAAFYCPEIRWQL